MTRPLMAEPLTIGGLTLRNRLVATAHGTAAVSDGEPQPDDAAYWSRLSRGGAGMVITGGIQVAKESTLRNRYLSEAFSRETLDGFRARADAIREGGAVPVAQLCHLGAETLGANTVYPFVSPSSSKPVREPSPVRALTTDEVGEVAQAFADSAVNCAEAGFEAIELHGAHGYLIAQFLSSTMNTRTDRYGGSPAARATFLTEVLERTRSAIPGTPVGLRISVENDLGGLTLDDFAELLPIVQQRISFDFVDLTYGNRGYYVRDMATEQPPLVEKPTGHLRDLLGVPLVLCSAFREPEDIEKVLSSGQADMVGMARAYIADPDVANKLIADRADEVRPCVACNQDCRSFDPTALCTVNPDLGPRGSTLRPGAAHLLSGPQAGGRRVAIVGGGPAGLECALTIASDAEAASRDVQVTVFESGRELGGALRVASAAGHRTGWRRLLRYYAGRVAALGIEVRTGEPVRELESVEGFDHAVWAVGAEEDQPAIAGGLLTMRSTDFLSEPSAFAGISRLALVDDGFGGWPSVSSVEGALQRGIREVALLTPGTAFAAAIPPESRLQLMERLRGQHVEVLPLSSVERSDSDGVVLRHTLTGQLRHIEAQGLVVVGTRRQRELPEAAAEGPSVWAIGDVLAPRQVSHAITEGRHAGLAVLWAITAKQYVTT